MARILKHLKRISSPKDGRTIGQGLAEFALILPVLLLLIFMIIALGRLLQAWLAIENGARFAVRYATTGEYDSQYFDDTKCAAFYAPFGVTCDTESKKENAARILSIQDQAKAGAAGILRDDSRTWDERGFFKVTVCSSGTDPSSGSPFVTFPSNTNNWATDWSADCQPYESAGVPGSTVVVTVDFNHQILVPFLSSIYPWLHLTASRQATVEQFRVSRIVGVDATLVLPSPTPTASNTPTDTPTPSPTNTPTETATATATFTASPTPDCSLLSVSSVWISGHNFYVNIYNGTPADVQLTSSTITWTKQYSNQRLRYQYFPGSHYASPNDSSSPTTVGAAPVRLSSGSTGTFRVYFSGLLTPGLVGDITASLMFDARCPLSASLSVATPTVTNTPTPSDTPTITWTPTITPIPTNTPIPPPTFTPTNTLVPTNTVPPPTATNTSPPPTATNTSPPPTATNTPSPVTPTSTSTPSLTPTDVVFDG